MAKTPFPPFQKRLLDPKFGAGMDQGFTKRTGNTAIHSMLGTLDGSDAYFRLPSVQAATHWGIGGQLDGVKNGAIYQWVEIGSNRIPWASGPWRTPGFGDGYVYTQTWGVYGINAYEESIELSGQRETPVTSEQWQSLIWLMAAIIHAAGKDSDRLVWETQDWKQSAANMHHREFCQPSYKDCPWPRVYNYTMQYLTAVKQTLQHYEGKSVSDVVKIGGLLVPLPFDQNDTKPTRPPDHPLFVAFESPQKAVLKVGATYRQYGNTTATIYRVVETKNTIETFVGYYHGQTVQGSDKWYVVDSDLHERVHESGIDDWKDM